ncbi:DNA helicase IV [Labedella gwakjiensis]|uniref:AAA family ATPase n=1 Tax=Labedella gwakjiensis TaxID=390269 RepID=A0A2P8GUN4_9MICO|nr:RNA polymerase recycling motor ATPase HelR [Labedella gwakjiensis]PSL37665.1 DNA helicase IV [Labedella gwakjiensis]RUQ87740.1 AAA family ATPase [Labedella gwakjiensis]
MTPTNAPDPTPAGAPAPGPFDLPDRLAAKRDERLIAADTRHFSRIAEHLERSTAELTSRLASERRAPGGGGQQALERDLEIHRLSSRLRALGRFSLDACLGRMVAQDGAISFVGRFGLTDESGDPLLLDWRSPAAAPFFAATRAEPNGLASRRRYRWSRGRITDYWDEAFTDAGVEGSAAALDDESAFIASLGQNRTSRMRDVLGTIQSDQDAIIRASSRGALVVDGGPGTGKTVVALHRTAYLLYSDPRLSRSHGGVLFVGPNDGYLAYVEDVLPSLGEEGVLTCTLRDLVPGGSALGDERDPAVAALKADADVAGIVEAAVRYYERPPAGRVVETPWADIELDDADWAEAFDAPDGDTSHNDARAEVWEALLEIIQDRLGDAAPPHQVRRALTADEDLTRTFARAWPTLDPLGVVADLWSVPAYLRLCAPGLSAAQVQTLQREDPRAWTVSDLPFLDAARARIGDPGAARRAREAEVATASEREQRDRVMDELIASDDSELGLMSILRGDDARNSLATVEARPVVDADLLAGPFAHIVVDEAQELTDAEWGMLVRRCPSRSLTIVGDRAQARRPFIESWGERLARVGLSRAEVSTLTINYRTPLEVMEAAEPVIRTVLPDANVPTSVRRSGVPVYRGMPAELGDVLDAWLAEEGDGVACVIHAPDAGVVPDRSRAGVQWLTPELAKGLEFDLVVLLDPERFGGGVVGTVDRYVAMTRATQRLVLLAPR